MIESFLEPTLIKDLIFSLYLIGKMDSEHLKTCCYITKEEDFNLWLNKDFLWRARE